MPKFIPADPRAKQKFDRAEACENCLRPPGLCICARVVKNRNALRVVVLQHPQEQFKVLNSARLTHLSLANSAIHVGLSWPSFKTVAGPDEKPSLWGVLYLKPDTKTDAKTGGKKVARPLISHTPKRQPLVDTSILKGLIALDGTWKQSKALWWRNSWLLKLNRISLNPDHPSLRPQVKTEGLSTLEAVAFALEHLGEKPEISASLREQYAGLILGNPDTAYPTNPANPG
ncbi:MAG: tRNA-uridine aminocarboxypropyltransferase [Fibrobacteria bacterium]